MNIKKLKQNEIEYITQYHSIEDIEESTPKEVANFLWLYYATCLTLGEAQQRYKEILNG